MTDFPNDETGDVLRAMLEHGIDLSVPHMVDFENVFPSEQSAREFAAAASDAAAEVIVHPPDPEDAEDDEEEEWDVQCRVLLVPSHATISRTELYFAELAERFGGSADGWGTMDDSDPTPSP